MLRLVRVSESFAVCLVLLDDFSVQKIIRIHRNDQLEFIHDVILQNQAAKSQNDRNPIICVHYYEFLNFILCSIYWLVLVFWMWLLVINYKAFSHGSLAKLQVLICFFLYITYYGRTAIRALKKRLLALSRSSILFFC